MAPLSPDEIHRISTTTLGVTAQILTVCRIYIRGRSKRLWWDDAWAILAMLLSVVNVTCAWLSASPAVYWGSILSFTCMLWAARMSIIFSVIRLIPPSFILRRISEWTAVIFFLLWAAVLTLKTYICGSDRSWYHSALSQCHLGPGVGITELTTDFFADIALAFIPIRLLQGVGLSTDKRRMLYIMFGASLLISVVSIVHAYFVLGPSGLPEGISAEAEAATALMVANMGILSPYVYKLMKNGQDFDSKPYTYYPSFDSDGQLHMRRVSRRSGDQSQPSTLRFQVAASTAETELEAPNPNKSGTSSVTSERDFEGSSKPLASSSTRGGQSVGHKDISDT